MDGLLNKDQDFWKTIKEFDVVGLVETWVEEKHKTKLEKILPKGYRWRITPATREKRMGRARKGMVTGIREDIEEECERDWQITEDIHIRHIRLANKERWRFIAVYCPQEEGKKIWKKILDCSEEPETENILIMGDMNARIGEEGGLILLNEEEETKRNSMDKTLNQAGKILLEAVGQRNWYILNGNITGDVEGNFTFYGAGQSVIDYAVANLEALERIKAMEVINRVESSHMMIKVELLEEIKKQSTHKIEKVYQVWNEDTIREFKKLTNQMILTGGDANKMMDEFVEKVNEATTYKRTIFDEGKLNKNSWWDRECREKKRKLNNLIRSKKKGKAGTEHVKEARKN